MSKELQREVSYNYIFINFIFYSFKNGNKKIQLEVHCKIAFP